MCLSIEQNFSCESTMKINKEFYITVLEIRKKTIWWVDRIFISSRRKHKNLILMMKKFRDFQHWIIQWGDNSLKTFLLFALKQKRIILAKLSKEDLKFIIQSGRIIKKSSTITNSSKERWTKSIKEKMFWLWWIEFDILKRFDIWILASSVKI